MRIFLVGLLALCSVFSFSQGRKIVKLNGTGGANLSIYWPADTSTAKPWFVFIPGNGESNTDTNDIFVQGPSKYIKEGWTPTDFWVITIQPPSGNPGTPWTKMCLDYLSASHNLDDNRLYLTGLSYGCGAILTYVGTGLYTWTSPTFLKPAAVIPMSYSRNSTANDTRYSEIAVWPFGSLSDGHAVSLRNWYNTYVKAPYPTPEKVEFTTYTGGHCCWNQFYDPNYVGSTGRSIYNWAMQFSRGGSVPTNNPPTAVAGNDLSATLPITQVNLNGSSSFDTDGSIVSYSWTKISGPSGTSFGSSTSATSTFNFTSIGTYVVRLTVTDDDGATGTDDITITVDDEEEPPVYEVREVIISEYKVAFLKNDSTAWAPYWSGGATRAVQYAGGHKFADGDGGLYNILLRKANGDVYVTNNSNTNLTFLQYDTNNVEFKAIDVECYLRTYIAVRNDSTIWAMSYNSYRWFGSDQNFVLQKWTKIPNQPAGVKFVSVTKGGITGQGQLVALTSTGQVWILADNSTTWVQKTLPGAVSKIYGGLNNFYLAIINGQPYGWGQGKYLGLPTGTISTYQALAETWGLNDNLIIDMAVNDNTIHYIIQNYQMYGMGDNVQGEVGTGSELVNRKELYVTSPSTYWYVWNWVTAIQGNYNQNYFVTTPVRIRPDKLFSRVWAGNYYAYYKYAQEYLTGKVFSWGRNKGAVLMNGKGASNESAIPNSMDVLIPTEVSVFSTTTPAPSTFVPGTINAGSNQSISSTSTTLSGTATPGKTNSWTYTITNYDWRKISGPACTIVNPTSSSTSVTGMSTGTYLFELKVTDNNTATITDTVQVSVNISGNNPPTVTVSGNILTSDDSVRVSATGADSDGTIVSYSWAKLSGPSGDIIVNTDQSTTDIIQLQQGTYIYQVTVTDDDGATASAQITVVVTPVNIPPTANAGEDQVILDNSIEIEGLGVDTDGTITSYQWSKLSGPKEDTIVSASSAKTLITFKRRGTYIYRFTVFDNSGASASDDVIIIVRPDINVTIEEVLKYIKSLKLKFE